MEGNVCVETSTRAADRMASALQGVAVINSSNLKDSLYCLGGIKVPCDIPIYRSHYSALC